MKTPTQVADAITRHVAKHWVALVSAAVTGAPGPGAFPLTISLGHPTRADLRGDLSPLRDRSRSLQDWVADQPGLRIATTNRSVTGARAAPIPSHVIVPDLPSALRTSAVWSPGRYAAALDLARRVHDAFPRADLAAVLPGMEKLPPVERDRLITAATWFATHDDWHTYTPRQIPLPGISGKWLNQKVRRGLIEALTGANTSALQPNRPTRVHLTYVDPHWAASGGRRHDSWTRGDPSPLPYPLTGLLVCENKDTALWFPPVPGLVVMEGVGKAAAHNITELPWIEHAPRVLYWGDMDYDGYDILNTVRARRVNATSILMGIDTYRAYEPFGTNTNEHGNPVPLPDPVPNLPYLINPERDVYRRITDPQWNGHRRIEQERIPLPVAVHCVTRLLHLH